MAFWSLEYVLARRSIWMCAMWCLEETTHIINRRLLISSPSHGTLIPYKLPIHSTITIPSPAVTVYPAPAFQFSHRSGRELTQHLPKFENKHTRHYQSPASTALHQFAAQLSPVLNPPPKKIETRRCENSHLHIHTLTSNTTICSTCSHHPPPAPHRARYRAARSDCGVEARVTLVVCGVRW